MIHFSAAERIAAPADAIWALLANLANPKMIEGFMASLRVDGDGNGAVRTFTLLPEHGGGEVSERIYNFDPAGRSYAYRVLDVGALPFAEYDGRLTVAPAGPGQAVYSYVASFIPAGDTPDNCRAMVAGNFNGLVRNIRRALAV